MGNFGAFSLNGGGGDITYFLTKSFGIKAEFGGTTSQTQTVTLNLAPCQTPPCKLSTQGNLFTYNTLGVYKARAASSSRLWRWDPAEPIPITPRISLQSVAQVALP